jgi:hypothetical protein
VLEAHQAQILLVAGNSDAKGAPVWRRVSVEPSRKKRGEVSFLEARPFMSKEDAEKYCNCMAGKSSILSLS